MWCDVERFYIELSRLAYNSRIPTQVRSPAITNLCYTMDIAMSEPTALKVFEHAYYIGNYVGGVLLGKLLLSEYVTISLTSGIVGVNLIVYVLIIRGLFDGRNDAILKRRFHAFFATSMIVILVIEAITATVWGEEMWIVSRDNIMAGGVPGWILTKENVWYGMLRVACADALAAFGDAFLVSISFCHRYLS